MSGAEYAAYLHAKVSGDARALTVDYDPHYCRAFATKDSVWTLHLADRVPEKRSIRLPKGPGPHVIRVENRGT